MAESEETLRLKRRARRRLVGAIALVTLAVIILPLILDKEPGPAGPPLSVQIPSQESGGFNTPVAPSAAKRPVVPAPQNKTALAPVSPPAGKAAVPGAKAEPAEASKAAEPVVVSKATEPAVVSKATEPAVPSKAAKAPSKVEEARALAALNDQAWVVTLDAFSEEKNVKQLRARLSAAGVKSYTEPVMTSQGALTRVRAGPFASKDAAEKARKKLDAMGLKPGAVVAR